MGGISNSQLLFPIHRTFRGNYFYQKPNQDPMITAYKGFSLWHSLSSMFAHIVLELPQTHSQGLPIVISKAYCCNIYLRNHRYFFVFGNSRTILPITRLADSTNIATFVGIVILSLGYQSHRQHIIWSMVLWFERISKYCASMLYCLSRYQIFIFHGELYRIVADRLQLLLEDTLYQLSHLLDGLKINLSNWHYACSQQVTEQAQTAPTSTLPPTINPSLLPRQLYRV